MRAGVFLTGLIVAACGDSASPAPDAGAPPRLEIQTPPGDTIGLTPSASIDLRVRLVTAEGTPIAGAATTWKLVGAGGTGGATLAVATAATDGDGMSTNTLSAGPARVDFEVTVDAGDAPQATFFVSVSASGFTNVRVTPLHMGPRTDIDHVELRAYRDGAGCAGLDPDALPASNLAPRTAPAFGVPVEWPMLPSGEAYTIVAWGVHPVSMKAIAYGCAAVVGSQVQPGELSMTLAVGDRALAIGSSTVTTSLDLSPAIAAETADGIDRPWRVLACPAGAGQLALDWIVDALANDGALDGVTINPSGPAATIQNARGALGGDGCRAETKGTGPSLDAKLDDAIAMGGFPRATLVAGRTDALAPSIVSELADVGAGRFRESLAHVIAAGETIELAASARPVIASEASWTYANGVLHLDAHGFTARLGSALGLAFADGPASGWNANALGAAMFSSAKSGAAAGCPAIDQIVCPAAGLGAGCTSSACAPAASALDPALTAWWRALDGPSIDLTWTGTANATDADGDLVIDDVTGGLWSATLATSLGPIATTGTWTSVATPPP